MAAVTALEDQTGMLQLEITRGQIGPKDLEKVVAKLKAMCSTLYGVTSFAVSRPFSSFFLSRDADLFSGGRSSFTNKMRAKKTGKKIPCLILL